VTAVSLDGRLVAVAHAEHFSEDDPTSAAVYLYDIHDPREPHLVRRIVFGSQPLSFAFSRDGGRPSQLDATRLPSGAKAAWRLDLRALKRFR
jgi:hypothetical protein